MDNVNIDRTALKDLIQQAKRTVPVSLAVEFAIRDAEEAVRGGLGECEGQLVMAFEDEEE